MNTNLVEQRLIEKIRQLSSPRIVEIEDFIDFLYQRENQEQLAIDRTAPTTNEMIVLAHSGNSFDFLYDEPDLYTLADGEPV
jgi:hypothetical protein